MIYNIIIKDVKGEKVILCDNTIRKMVNEKKIIIKPFNDKFVGPGSYDLTLSGEFGYYFSDYYNIEDDCEKYLKKYKFNNGDKILIFPNWWEYDSEMFEDCDIKHVFYGGVLGLTNEIIELPNNICAQYQGRSSLGRIFLTSHQTAGWIDAGFKGRIVLELVAHDRPVILTIGKRIGQLIFLKMDNNCDVGYCDMERSKYKNQYSVIGIKKDKF